MCLESGSAVAGTRETLVGWRDAVRKGVQWAVLQERRKAVAGRPDSFGADEWYWLWQASSWIGRSTCRRVCGTTTQGRDFGIGGHGRVAVWTGRWWCGWEFGRLGGRQWQVAREGQLCLEQAQGLAFGAVVQPVVTDFAEAGWQHVQQEATDELVGGEA